MAHEEPYDIIELPGGKGSFKLTKKERPVYIQKAAEQFEERLEEQSIILDERKYIRLLAAIEKSYMDFFPGAVYKDPWKALEHDVFLAIYQNLGIYCSADLVTVRYGI